MRKEYSDLPDSQKVTYYKRGVVYGICVALPIALLLGSFFGIIYYYEPMITEQTKVSSMNTTTNDTPIKSNPGVEASILLLLIMVAIGVVGIGAVGENLTIWVCDKLKLWTDFQLEAAERRVADIKKELSK